MTLSIKTKIIGFLFSLAYPISHFYNNFLPGYLVYLFLSLGFCLILFGNLVSHYSNKLIIILFFTFIGFSLLPLVINNITIWLWLMLLTMLMLEWYIKNEHKKEKGIGHKE